MEMHIKQILRAQAWERAKGEMLSMLYTFYEDTNGTFHKLDEAIKRFINEVEENGLNH